MKGIILAGGKGTRLYPATQAVSKQILPIYDKPMIYYPLSVLMMADIQDILIISTPRDLRMFKELLGDGQDLGIRISYKAQKDAKGIAQAFIIGKDFIGQDRVALILGDNLFYGYELEGMLQQSIKNSKGATVFGYLVDKPQDFGVVEFDEEFNVISIEEKPQVPKSQYAVPGLYFYDNQVIALAKQIKPSPRGELEITTINQVYLEKGELKVEILPKGIAWIDTGTHSALLKASQFVEAIQNTQGIYIGSPEELAYKKGYITRAKLIELASRLHKTKYGDYLMQLQ